MLCPVLTRRSCGSEPAASRSRPFKLTDGGGRPFVLSLSHETMTFHAREIQSYKQLPQIWYHFSTKERDEPRRGAASSGSGSSS